VRRLGYISKSSAPLLYTLNITATAFVLLFIKHFPKVLLGQYLKYFNILCFYTHGIAILDKTVTMYRNSFQEHMQ